MSAVTRRKVLLSAAGAAAFGLAGEVRMLPSARAADVRQRGYVGYRIGEIACTAFYDGIWRKPHDIPRTMPRTMIST